MNLSTVASFSKTRIAPTPSGYLHLGNIFSFIITSALAQSHAAKLLLRIDDLDTQRAEPRYFENIFDTLQLLPIHWQEGPQTITEIAEYSQLTRLPIYKEYLQQLIKKNAVYACTCSRTSIAERTGSTVYDGYCRNKNLSLTTKDAVLRLKTDHTQLIAVHDANGHISHHALPAEMNDFVVWKKDNFPAYQLASFCDDIYYSIDFIVRGSDLFASTLAQLYLAELLQIEAFKTIRFLHHPLLKNTSGDKLSKSAGAQAVNTLLQTEKSSLLQQLLQFSPLPYHPLLRHALL